MNIANRFTAPSLLTRQAWKAKKSNSKTDLTSFAQKFFKSFVGYILFLQYFQPILSPIGKNGHTERAFNLAERYRDFQSLASLCHKEAVYPVDENPSIGRIQYYLDKFKEEFATALYRWYIEQGGCIFISFTDAFRSDDNVGMYRRTTPHVCS
jgi:hypothetical protein